MEGQWFSRSPTLGTDLMALESVHLGQKQVIIYTEIHNDNKRIKKKAIQVREKNLFSRVEK